MLCLRFPEISMVQVKISILDGERTQELRSSVKNKRIGVLARQPFGSGELWRNAARYDFLVKSGGRTLARQPCSLCCSKTMFPRPWLAQWTVSTSSAI